MSDGAVNAGAVHTLLQASRCAVQQHVLGGLLHDLNGPLNNIALTLALLSATVAREVAASPGDAGVQRLVRHAGTLETELRRLTACSHAMSSVLHAEGAGPEPVVLHDMALEVQRQLRHHAAMHEITLDATGEADGTAVDADRDMLRFALLALVLALCGVCAPGARVALDARRRGDDDVVRISARPATLSDAGRAAFDSAVVSPPSEWLHLVAGRAAATAQGALVSLASGERDEVVIEVALRARR